MTKKYMLDKSVLLQYPYAIHAFEDNEVILPMSVVAELGMLSHLQNPNHANAAETIRLLDGLFCDAEHTSVADLPHGGTLHIVGTKDETDLIWQAERSQAIIVSLDPYVRVQARLRGVCAETFKALQIPEGIRVYEGRCRFYVSADEMTQFAREKKLVLKAGKVYYAESADRRVQYQNYQPTMHEYIVLVNAEQPDGATMLGRFDGQKIVPLHYRKDSPVYGVTARNAGQQFALDALTNPDIPLVILRGPAGTAKTFLSMAAGLNGLERGEYNRILLTRPNTKMDADVGYLKGGEQDKVLPVLRGLTDNAEVLLADRKKSTLGTLDDLLAAKKIEAQAMAYMRGRNITRQYMVADEMQNATPSQALSIITRIGEKSKLIVLGDPDQIDDPYLSRENNGLNFAAARMKGSPFCAQVTFLDYECERSYLAEDALIRMRTVYGSH